MLYLLAIAAAAFLSTSSPQPAGIAPDETKLVKPGSAGDSSFGAGLAASGDLIAIGSPQFQTNNKGEVYLFQGHSTYSVLLPSLDDPSFGKHVAMDDVSLAVVGKLGTYLYSRRNGVWVEDLILPVSPVALALDKGRLVLGRAPTATLVYVRDPADSSSWSIEAMLLPSDGMVDLSFFGGSVASEGKTIVVGASEHAGGAAYVFSRQDDGSWQEVVKLTEGLDANAAFGWAVETCRGEIVIGAPRYGNRDQGAAFVFSNPNGDLWTLSDRIDPRIDQSLGFFGGGLSASNDNLLVSAHLQDVRAEEGSGVVYHYVRGANGSWQLSRRMHALDFLDTTNYGIEVTSSPTMLAVGAYQPRKGDAVYLYELAQ